MTQVFGRDKGTSHAGFYDTGDPPIPPIKPPSPFNLTSSLDKLLVTLEELTPLRGERMQEIYFVILCHDPHGKPESFKVPQGKSILAELLPNAPDLDKFFYGVVTPIVPMRLRKPHCFDGELCLFHGVPGELKSLYLAVVESDSPDRNLGQSIRETHQSINSELLPEQKDHGAAFAWMVRVLELALLRKGDQLCYSNVFTFHKQDDYLAGNHTFANQWISFNLEVEPPEI
jgi:hypothetical protein